MRSLYVAWSPVKSREVAWSRVASSRFESREKKCEHPISLSNQAVSTKRHDLIEGLACFFGDAAHYYSSGGLRFFGTHRKTKNAPYFSQFLGGWERRLWFFWRRGTYTTYRASCGFSASPERKNSYIFSKNCKKRHKGTFLDVSLPWNYYPYLTRASRDYWKEASLL